MRLTQTGISLAVLVGVFGGGACASEADEDEDDSGIWSAGVEARIAEGLWASAGFGSRFAALAEESEKTFVLVGIRWGISSAARLDALRPLGR